MGDNDERSLGSDIWDERSGEDGNEDDSDSHAVANRRASSSKRSLERRCLVTCHVCIRPFKTMDGYKKHLKMHRLDELFQRFPVDNAVISVCRQEIPGLLQGIAAEEAQLPLTKEINAIAADLLHLTRDDKCDALNFIVNEMMECVHGFTSTSLSAFDASLKKCVYGLLANSEKRSHLLQVLQETVPRVFSDSVGHWITQISLGSCQ